MVGPLRARMLDNVVLGSYVQPTEWDCPSTDKYALGPEAALSIIDRWNPFNKRDYSVMHIRKLYSALLRVLVVAHVEEYFIPFPDYLEKKSFQNMAEDEMYIRNRDFNKTAKLVLQNF